MSVENENLNGVGPPTPLLSKPICQAMRTDGTPCGAPPGQSGLCFWHDPAWREDRLDASRKGGSRKAFDLPVGAPIDASEARGLLTALIAALLQGAVDPATVRTVAYVMQVDRKIAEAEALERRISALEDLVADGRRRG